MKLGWTDVPYVRTMSQHGKDFGGVVVVDSIVCKYPAKVEKKLKKWPNMQARFISCKSEKKKTTETEVVAVKDHEDCKRIYEYDQAVMYAKEFDAESDENDTRKQLEGMRKEMALLRNAMIALWNAFHVVYKKAC